MKPSLSSESYISGGHTASGLRAIDSCDRDQFRAGLGGQRDLKSYPGWPLFSKWVFGKMGTVRLSPCKSGLVQRLHHAYSVND